MLGYLVPDMLQRGFVSLVGGLPLAVQQFVFVVLCSGFLLALSRAIRFGLLHLDVVLALRAQRQGQAVPVSVHLSGWTAVGQWFVILALCLTMLVATALFSGARAIRADSGSPFYTTVRSIQICLSPNSGTGDSLARCLWR